MTPAESRRLGRVILVSSAVAAVVIVLLVTFWQYFAVAGFLLFLAYFTIQLAGGGVERV